MASNDGYAAFHVKHNPKDDSGHRKGLVTHMMRELDDDTVRFYASQNLNIDPDASGRNIAMVNDGEGGWKRPDSVKEVLDYGDDRLGRVGRKLRDDQAVTSTFVVYLPRTMLTEIPNAMPAVEEDGTPITNDYGDPIMKSRYVARDQEEMFKYFVETVAWLRDTVVPGGHDAIHGFDINLDETTPHIHVLTDPFAEDPQDPEKLRTKFSQVWTSHRDVRYPADHPKAGKKISGPVKLKQYHADFREHMRGLGFDVESQPSPRAHESFTKERYVELENERLKNESTHAALDEAFGTVMERQDQLVTVEEELNQKVAAFPEARDKALAAARKQGRSEGHAEGLAEGKAEAAKTIQEAQVKAKQLVSDAEEEVPKIRLQARKAGARDAEAEASKVRADADTDAAVTRETAKTDAERVRRQAREDAQRRRREVEKLEAEAKTDRQAAAADRAGAAGVLQDAESVLARVKAVPDLDVDALDADTRDSMKKIDADFLDRLCEKNPSINKMRKENQARLFSKNQAERARANKTYEQVRHDLERQKQRLGGRQTADQRQDDLQPRHRPSETQAGA